MPDYIPRTPIGTDPKPTLFSKQKGPCIVLPFEFRSRNTNVYDETVSIKLKTKRDNRKKDGVRSGSDLKEKNFD